MWVAPDVRQRETSSATVLQRNAGPESTNEANTKGSLRQSKRMEFISNVEGGQDRYRPSFFELAAQGMRMLGRFDGDVWSVLIAFSCISPKEQLRDLLPPVVKYVLSVSDFGRLVFRLSRVAQPDFAFCTSSGIRTEKSSVSASNSQPT